MEWLAPFSARAPPQLPIIMQSSPCYHHHDHRYRDGDRDGYRDGDRDGYRDDCDGDRDDDHD